MKKDELRKLRKLPATSAMMKKALETIETEDYSGKTVTKPKYKVMARVQCLGKYMKASLFNTSDMKKGRKEPRYEVFINKEGKEWISRELDKDGKEVAWTESMISNLSQFNLSFYYGEDNPYIYRDGMENLNRLKLMNDNGEKGLLRLFRWQKELRAENIKKQEEREQQPWDEEMKLVPSEPKGFREWMRKDVCRDVFIIYDYKRGKITEGYCSRCRKVVKITEPRHNQETSCPNCRKDAVFKSSGKIKSLYTKTYSGQVLQKIPDGIVIRRFRTYQRYNVPDYKQPYMALGEEERLMIYDDGTVNRYVWESYKNKKIRWCPDKGFTFNNLYYRHYYDNENMIYKRNIKKLKESTELLRRSSFDRWEKLPCSLGRYIAVEKGNPAVEKLVKIDMFRLAEDIIDERYDYKLLDEKQTELTKMLRIDQGRLKRLKNMNANIYSLKWMQMEKLANTMWPDEMIKKLGEEKLESSDFFFLKNPVDFQKAYRYVYKQSKQIDESMKQTLITWRDYFYMAEQMKMNTKLEQIEKPKNVKEAHDRLVMMQKEKGMEKKAAELKKKWKKVEKHLVGIQKFEYENGDYCIVAPKTILDIVKEGMILGHCVHTCDYYFSRIETDETYLFFLRKKVSKDMPWYTLEVEPSGNIRQKRTTGDKQNADFQKALPFLKKWQKYFKSILTEKEKKLGEKADALRKEEYKKLRIDGNKVWHGPLAGKLLADVLEADFMEAI